MKVRLPRPESAVIVGAMTLLISSAFALCYSSAAFGVVPVPKICMSVATAVCADCDATSNAYQCTPPALPFGQIYGACSPANVNSCSIPYVSASCGQSDSTCDAMPVVIPNGLNCAADSPQVCEA